MDGYDVITSDEHKVGRVQGAAGETLLVEHGLLRKRLYALPRTFAHADDEARVVRATVPKDILLDAPTADAPGEIDEHAVALHYGLAAADPAPPQQGLGDVVEDDPIHGVDRDAQAAGIEPAEEERARIRRGHGGEVGSSPALLGDRLKHVRDD
jgi:hypothetical protein